MIPADLYKTGSPALEFREHNLINECGFEL